MGVPGWPELAAWTASIDKVRIVLIAVTSSGSCADLITGFLSTVPAMIDSLGLGPPLGSGRGAACPHPLVCPSNSQGIVATSSRMFLPFFPAGMLGPNASMIALLFPSFHGGPWERGDIKGEKELPL